MREIDGVKEADNKLPVGWLLFYIALILWAVWYMLTYTPEISGWSYYKDAYQPPTVQKSEAPKADTNPFKGNAEAIAEGRELFASNCSACHGDNLKGGVGPDLTASLKYGDADRLLYESVEDGRPGGMPPYAGQLNQDAIWKTLAYISSLRK